jgi:hypothetical protein
MVMGPIDPAIGSILACYQWLGSPQQIVELGNAGGFSGASFWRCELGGLSICLRRWPTEHPSAERLGFIHRVLRHLADTGIRCIPAPLETDAGASFLDQLGHFWEVSRWMPGRADFHDRPSNARLSDAMTVLAQIHVASGELREFREFGVGRGLIHRSRQIREITNEKITELLRGLNREPRNEIREAVQLILDLLRCLAPTKCFSWPQIEDLKCQLMPSIRDIWHDHVLFDDDRVSGIVDFGAMQVDSSVGDIARLVGSLVGDNSSKWNLALRAYAAVRPLSDQDRQLIKTFDLANVILSGWNWAHWLYVDRRTFSDTARVVARLREIRPRLQNLVENPCSVHGI